MSGAEAGHDGGAVATAAPAPAPAFAVTKSLLVAFWLSEASRQRIIDACPVEISEDARRTAEADIIAISTRVPRGRSVGLVEDLREVTNVPIVVVCHAGGESIAVELMQAGAVAVVGEGNEAGLRAVMGMPDGDDSLLASYEKRVDRYRAGDTSNRGRDPVTNLPGSSAFELRLAELSQGGLLPRVGFVEIIHMDSVLRGMDREAVRLMRRRLGVLFADQARRAGAELFTLDEATFALLSGELPVKAAQDLGRAMAEVAATFSPLGAEHLTVAFGHAGPEVASDVRIARELAERALEAARSEDGGATISADELSRTLATSTELETALKLVAVVDDLDGNAGPHSARVADYAGELARQLGYDGQDYVRIRLAALLHDVGKVGLPIEAQQTPGPGTNPEHAEQYRSHSARSDRYVQVSAGPEVSAAVRGHHERWDGTGFPDGLSQEEIPLGARIIAVADAYDNWSNSVSGPNARAALTMREVVQRLQEESGKAFDPMVVRAAPARPGAGARRSAGRRPASGDAPAARETRVACVRSCRGTHASSARRRVRRRRGPVGGRGLAGGGGEPDHAGEPAQSHRGAVERPGRPVRAHRRRGHLHRRARRRAQPGPAVRRRPRRRDRPRPP
jgi:HD-GYP domain-containing protein (c-di-GMP phosphodiesterase class II)